MLSLISILVIASGCSRPGGDINGRWSATLKVGQVPVPFRLDLVNQGATATGYLFDGEQRIASSAGSYQDGKLHLHFDLYNSDLEATVRGTVMDGTYTRRGGKKTTERTVTAVRYTPPSTGQQTASLAGSWQLTSLDAKEKADWKMVLQQNGAEVTGAILRLDGDTGAMTGTFQDGKLSISHFSGARPALLEGQLKPDGTLALVLDRDLHLKGVRNDEAAAPDAFHATTMKNPQEPFHFEGTDADGHALSSTDSRFRGKVVIASIGGSWCPNCMDEAPFLVDLYRRYHDRGLEIVGLNFESGNTPYDRGRVKTFVAKYDLPYPVIIAGTTDDAKAKLPQLENFSAFPTTIFIGRDGLVHGIHDGFASVATGAEHAKLKQETDEIVEGLLANRKS